MTLGIGKHKTKSERSRRPREQFSKSSGITMMCYSCEVSSFHIKTSLLSLISMNRSGLIVRPTTRTSAMCDYMPKASSQENLILCLSRIILLRPFGLSSIFRETESNDMTQGPFLVSKVIVKKILSRIDVGNCWWLQYRWQCNQ